MWRRIPPIYLIGFFCLLIGFIQVLQLAAIEQSYKQMGVMLGGVLLLGIGAFWLFGNQK